MVHTPPFAANQFHGPSPLPFHPGPHRRHFPKLPTTTTSLRQWRMHHWQTNVPRPNYQYPAWPYENIYPPAYPPASWQPTTIPYTTRPPAFGTTRSLPGSLHRPRSSSRAVETDGPSDYPELIDLLEHVDQDHLHGSCFPSSPLSLSLQGLHPCFTLSGCPCLTLSP